jgi:hypothetical protein
MKQIFLSIISRSKDRNAVKRLPLLALTCVFLAIAQSAVAAPLACTISGVVYAPDGTTPNNPTVTSAPAGQVPQITGGVAVHPQYVSATTDGSGNLIPISLLQGAAMNAVICRNGGGCGAQVSVPVMSVATIGRSLANTQVGTSGSGVQNPMNGDLNANGFANTGASSLSAASVYDTGLGENTTPRCTTTGGLFMNIGCLGGGGGGVSNPLTLTLSGGGHSISGVGTLSSTSLTTSKVVETIIPNSGPPYYVSGSAQTTLGSISAESSTLTLTSALDFQNSEGIEIFGAGTLDTYPSVPTPTVTATGTTGSTSYTYKIFAIGKNGGWSASSSAYTITNGAASLTIPNPSTNTGSGNSLTWTAMSGISAYGICRCTGPSCTPQFYDIVPQASYLDTGYAHTSGYFPATCPTASQAGPLFTTISSGGGRTKLRLVTSAISNATGVRVYHNDGIGLASALAAAVAIDGHLHIPGGTYYMDSPDLPVSGGMNSSCPNFYAPGPVNLTVDGDGEGVTVLKFAPFGWGPTNCFFLYDKSGAGHITVHDLTVDGNQNNVGFIADALGQDRLLGVNSGTIIIHDIEAGDFQGGLSWPNYCIQAGTGWTAAGQLDISHNHVHDCGRDGGAIPLAGNNSNEPLGTSSLGIQGLSPHFTAIGNHIVHTHDTALEEALAPSASGATNIFANMSGNILDNVAGGIYLFQNGESASVPINWTVEGNVMNGGPQSWQLNDCMVRNLPQATPSTDFVANIDNNSIQNTLYTFGICLNSASGGSIANNTLYKIGPTNVSNVGIGCGQCSQVAIIGNSLNTIADLGINVYGGANDKIDNNSVQNIIYNGTGGSAIQITGLTQNYPPVLTSPQNPAQNIEVSGNTVNNALTGLQVALNRSDTTSNTRIGANDYGPTLRAPLALLNALAAGSSFENSKIANAYIASATSLTNLFAHNSPSISHAEYVYGIQANTTNASPFGCSTNGVITLEDVYSGSVVRAIGAVTLSAQNVAVDVNYTLPAEHVLAWKVTTAAAGCSSAPSGINVTADYATF